MKKLLLIPILTLCSCYCTKDIEHENPTYSIDRTEVIRDAVESCYRYRF